MVPIASGNLLVPIFRKKGKGPPYSGTFIPEFPLAGFKGQNANGVWTITVIDRFAGDTGNVRAFSLVITSY